MREPAPLAMGTCGRPPAGCEEWANDAWHAELNSQPTADIRRCSTVKGTYWRECGKCLVLQSARAANRSATFRHCIYHSSGSEDPRKSQFGKDVRALLQQLAVGSAVYTESKVLGGSYGATDFGIPVRVGSQWRVLWVEADGPQHFTVSYQDTTAEEQKEVDGRKDSAALEQGALVVRLHYRDCGEWKNKLQHGLALVKNQPPCRGVIYTSSYQQEDTTTQLPSRCAPCTACRSPSFQKRSAA